MEVSNELHAPAAVSTGIYSSVSVEQGGRVGPKAGLDAWDRTTIPLTLNSILVYIPTTSCPYVEKFK